MKQKRSIQIETLTDIQLSVGNSVQTTEGTQDKEDCIFLLAHGYCSKEDREIEVPIFLSLEKAETLRAALFELLPHEPPFANQ